MLIILYILCILINANYFVKTNDVEKSNTDISQLIEDMKEIQEKVKSFEKQEEINNQFTQYCEILNTKQNIKEFNKVQGNDNWKEIVAELKDEFDYRLNISINIQNMQENKIQDLIISYEEFKKVKEELIESQNEIKQIKDELIQSQKEIKQTKQELIQSQKTLGRIQLLFDISMKMIISKNTFNDSDGKLKNFFIPMNENNEKNSFEEAINTCKEYNAILVEPKIAQKQQILELFFKELEFQGIKIRWFWINGKRDSSGKFKWISSGEEFTFSNWLPNKPDSSNGHDYVWLYSYMIGEETPKFGKWGNDPDEPNYTYRYVVCEKDKIIL